MDLDPLARRFLPAVGGGGVLLHLLPEGLDLLLAPPAAPLAPEVRLGSVGGSVDGDGPELERAWACPDLVWNLPALGTRSTRLALAPRLTKTILLGLPEGATPQHLRVLVRRQTLLLPVEAGQAYALHLGGEAKAAPGKASRLHATAAAAVVLPIPISPVPSMATPSAFASIASLIPTSRAATASSRVMAGPLAKFRVPRATFRATSSGSWPKSWSTPMRSTCTAFLAGSRGFPRPHPQKGRGSDPR